MKKLLLIPAALILSTGFAFAGGYGSHPATGLSLSQSASVTQSIGTTSYWSKAENKALVVQAQVPIGVKSGSLSQSATVDQSIGTTTYGSKAENKATVIQAQVPIGSFYP